MKDLVLLLSCLCANAKNCWQISKRQKGDKGSSVMSAVVSVEKVQMLTTRSQCQVLVYCRFRTEITSSSPT